MINMHTTVDLSSSVEKDLHLKETEEIWDQVYNKNIYNSCVNPIQFTVNTNVDFLLEHKIHYTISKQFKDELIRESLILNL